MKKRLPRPQGKRIGALIHVKEKRMNHLLCSLGTSEAVVIEAVCLLTDGFTKTDGLSVPIIT